MERSETYKARVEELLKIAKAKGNEYNTRTDRDMKTLDLNIVKEKSIANEFVCNICSNLPLNPIKCSKCLTIFCKDELYKWLENGTRTCPIKCKDIQVVSLTNLEQNLLGKIEFICNCNTEGLNYNNIMSHYSKCKEAMTEYYCNFCSSCFKSQKSIENHVIDCTQAKVVCEYCYQSVLTITYQTHLFSCIEECEVCRSIFVKSKHAAHASVCPTLAKEYYSKLYEAENRKYEELKVDYEGLVGEYSRKDRPRRYDVVFILLVILIIYYFVSMIIYDDCIVGIRKLIF
jgi:hypothetical protein